MRMYQQKVGKKRYRRIERWKQEARSRILKWGLFCLRKVEELFENSRGKSDKRLTNCLWNDVMGEILWQTENDEEGKWLYPHIISRENQERWCARELLHHPRSFCSRINPPCSLKSNDRVNDFHLKHARANTRESILFFRCKIDVCYDPIFMRKGQHKEKRKVRRMERLGWK